MKAKTSQGNRFIRIIMTPFRALGKARDYYVRSIMDCANSNIVGLQGTSQTPGLPRSFSVNSARSNDDEDYRELVRAASARSIGSRMELDSYVRQEEMKMRAGPRAGPQAMPPRSISVAMGKIDEDRPVCYFGGDIINNGNNVVNVKNELKYPRSKSHAVARTTF